MLKDENSMPLVDHDVVVGKGQGVIISLFGPPGVGKTLSAEATSEHLRRPLYRVGSGDLGSSATETDRELRRVCDLAVQWKAVLLIDEVSHWGNARYFTKAEFSSGRGVS